MTTALMLPDDFSVDDLESMDGFHELIARDPAKAMIYADFALKYKVESWRDAWLTQAEIIYAVKKSGIWKHEANGLNFNNWCKQPEIGIERATVSDMINIIRFAPTVLEETGVDIIAMIRRVGPSKLRAAIPRIRKTYQNGTMREELTPILEEIEGSTYREALQLLRTEDQRVAWDPEAIYEEVDDGTYKVTFAGLDYDALELLCNKTKVYRWRDPNGNWIDNPVKDIIPEQIDLDD